MVLFSATLHVARKTLVSVGPIATRSRKAGLATTYATPAKQGKLPHLRMRVVRQHSMTDDTISTVSSGLDFVDLIGMDDFTVLNCLQDAVTYRGVVTVGASIPAQAGAFNLKQLTSYRDNVTRNLAPTVARGFANAARAAGHMIAAPPSHPPTSTPARRPQPRPKP